MRTSPGKCKHYLQLLLLLLFFHPASSQNLVPNPGFEEHRGEELMHWQHPEKPYYHPDCSTGQAFAGDCAEAVCFWKYGITEYIQTVLSEPLMENEHYRLSIRIKLSDEVMECNADSIPPVGICISDRPLDVSYRKRYYLVPQASFRIKPDHSWQEYHTVITAKGGEQYLAIGNFLPDTIAVIDSSLYAESARKMDKLERDREESIAAAMQEISKKYKDIRASVSDYDKIKSERKREKLLENFRNSYKNMKKEMEDRSRQINLQFDKQSGAFHAIGIGYCRVRYVFDEIELEKSRESPVQEIQETPFIAEEGKVFRLNRVYFDIDKYDLLPSSYEELNKLTGFLNDEPGVGIDISGHTDITGNEPHNLELSGNRAKAVRDYLVQQGISRSRLTSKGFGSSMPVGSNATEEGRSINRRVEFMITKK
jgi:outer membrane protein OmpA-like peptidoglycan-associated protein